MRKRAWVTIIILIVLFAVGYKVCAYLAYVKNLQFENKGIVLSDNYTIKTNEIDENDYLVFDNIKMKNVFDEFTKYEDETNTLKYIQRFDDNKLNKAIYIGADSQFVDILLNNKLEVFSMNFTIEDPKYIKKVFDKNNIKNDIDLVNYFVKHYKDKTTFFNTISKQKEVYFMNTIANIIVPSLNNINLIDGDYEGFVFNANSVKEISIIKDNKKYYFTFIGDYEEEFIQDFMNTVVIE